VTEICTEVDEWKMNDDWMVNEGAWKMKIDLLAENQEQNDVKRKLV